MKSEEVRSCLLYAACEGGSLHVIRKFMSPDLDINKPVSLVRELTNSEVKTPLYGACKGQWNTALWRL